MEKSACLKKLAGCELIHQKGENMRVFIDLPKNVFTTGTMYRDNSYEDHLPPNNIRRQAAL